MSEYWVSKKRYYCKYCEIYIADDVPSRQQHEGGLRHKGNKERFVRGLYKASEKKKHDLEEEKREMVRVERAAQAAFAQDVGAGHAKAGPSVPPTARKPAPPAAEKPAKPSNPWANYSTAEQLGFQDPDAERLAAEAERRRTQGVVGAWEAVATDTPSPPTPAADAGADAAPAHAGQKRDAPPPPADEDDARAFKLRKKAWSAGLGEIWDPDAVPIKLKPKAAPVTGSTVAHASDGATTSTSAEPDTASTSERPKWTAKGWNKPGEHAASAAAEDAGVALKADPDDQGQVSSDPVEKEDAASLVDTVHSAIDVASPTVKSEVPVVKEEDLSLPLDAAAAEGSMFRKRKAPAGVRSRRQV